MICGSCGHFYIRKILGFIKKHSWDIFSSVSHKFDFPSVENDVYEIFKYVCRYQKGPRQYVTLSMLIIYLFQIFILSSLSKEGSLSMCSIA